MTLRERCEALASKIWHNERCPVGECICNLQCKGDLDEIIVNNGLEAFARQQQAVGLREAHQIMSKWFHEDLRDVEDVIDDIEQQAREREGTR